MAGSSNCVRSSSLETFSGMSVWCAQPSPGLTLGVQTFEAYLCLEWQPPGVALRGGCHNSCRALRSRIWPPLEKLCKLPGRAWEAPQARINTSLHVLWVCTWIQSCSLPSNRRRSRLRSAALVPAGALRSGLAPDFFTALMEAGC